VRGGGGGAAVEWAPTNLRFGSASSDDGEVTDAVIHDPALDELRQAYRDGDLVLFVGAGVSAAAGLPSWAKLVEKLLERARARGATALVLGEIDALLKKGRFIDALSAARDAVGEQELTPSCGVRACCRKTRFDPPWERLAPGLSEPDQAFVLSHAGFALRALGRLPEAAGLLRLGLERYIAQKSWTSAAVSASNLSELLQALGELSEAQAQAQKSVELADTSGDAFQRMARRTTLAAALHARGLREDAAAQFEEAGQMENERQPAYPQLSSIAGFQYCDILLDQDRDAEVRERAAQALEIAVRNNWLLDIALGHLSLGRAHLFALQHGTAGDLAQATSHLQQAVNGLRHAGSQNHLPRGLLARAALHTHTGNYPAARHDLDETLTLATRCGLRLHEADAHLGHARLALAEGDPTPALLSLAKARSLIDATGYHRRDGELTTLESEAAALVGANQAAPQG